MHERDARKTAAAADMERQKEDQKTDGEQ